jgi:hypothetical protein
MKVIEPVTFTAKSGDLSTSYPQFSLLPLKY